MRIARVETVSGCSYQPRVFFELRVAAVALALLAASLTSVLAFGDETFDQALAKVASVGRLGEGQAAATQAVAVLNEAGPEQILPMLKAMPSDNPLGENWLRGAIETAVAKAEGDATKLPLDELQRFVEDTERNPRARRLAFEILVKAKPGIRESLLGSMNQDPSLELRRDALVIVIGRADKALAEERKDEAVGLYRRAIVDARDLDQIQMLEKKLSDLGETVALSELFGFIMEWEVVGPFDNAGEEGFARATGPEIEATKNAGGFVDVGAEYDGKHGKVRWQTIETDDNYGKLDLNEPFAKEKGVCVYAYTEFVSPEERDAQLRLGCINASKAWVNGEEVFANDVYHTGTSVDQYIGKFRLKQGKNAILLKICQNEQTENWAEAFAFQCRVSDPTGAAIRSQDRPVPDAAVLPANQPAVASR
ncbi:MAG TPA: hypothetical protein VGN57_04375 [Pirellulaceae bacterium]|jgi:hypothetical protein|nr:hypothetical protein [Pirellulaceae bacterium]